MSVAAASLCAPALCGRAGDLQVVADRLDVDVLPLAAISDSS